MKKSLLIIPPIIFICFIYNTLKTNIQEIEVLNPITSNQKLSFLEKKHKENNHLYGWLKIENTKIDYPVMYSGDDYYLNHSFNRDSDKYGNLFIDKNNAIVPRDVNLIIHGHDTSDDRMFGGLKKYRDYDYYLNHKIIDFETLEHKEKYEIVSVFLSKVYYVSDNVFKYYKFYNTTNKLEYDNFIKNIKKLQFYDTEVVPKFPNELITLSTCDDSITNGRLVIVARKVT